jgi:replicative DNA helicase
MRKRSEARRAKAEAEEEQRIIREWQLDVPNDPVVEQVILAAMFADLATCDRIRPIAPPDFFYAKPHRRIRSAIELARLRGHSLDPVTLARLDPSVDVGLVEAIVGARPDVPEDLDLHLGHLRYDAERAKFAQGPAQSMLEALQDPTVPREKLRAIARTIGDFFSLEVGRGRYLRNTEHVIAEAMQAIEGRKPGVSHPFGIPGLDYKENGECRLRPGAAPGELTVLTGSTGSGKTTLLAHMILGLARQRKRVLVGAWEVRAPMTIEMLAIFSLGWNRSRFLDGYTGQMNQEKVPITKEDREIIHERMRAIGKWVVFMDNPVEKDLDDADNAQIVAVLEDHLEASGCDAATWDLLDRAINERNPDQEARMMRRVLRMGDRMRVHQIVVHQQLLKGQDVREDAKPTLKGIMGSSAFSQNAGLVLAPYMPSRHKAVQENTIEVYGLKQRYGEPFGVEFEWDAARGSLTGGRSFNPMDLGQGDESLGAPSKAFPAQRKKR